LYIIKKAYDEFEERAGQIAAPRGEKSEMVLNWIRARQEPFRLVDVESACPGVGRDWIRTLLFELKKEGRLTCSGKGRAARWNYEKE
jgi:hypothetical protein